MMAFDPGAIDSTLAAVAGDDPALAAELRIAFVDSAERALAALRASEDAGGWIEAALRIRGLAASFGALRLMAAAEEATRSAPGDVRLLRRIDRIIGGF